MNSLIKNKQLKILLSLRKLKSTFLYLSFFWGITTVISTVTTSAALAQITPDTTLDNSPSKVNSQNLNNLLIEGGVKNQGNLFHSFQEFNINNGQQVFFSNPQGIENIITRVTGNNPSNLNGVLGVNGLANLFFLNPNGIVFGKGSRLDVNGSFVGSTADSINFSEGNIFSAVEPNNPALLKINVPLGLQNGNNPAAIQLKQANLQVKPGKTIGLIGGNVSLDNTILKAPGGTIQLGGLLSSGTVELNDLKSFDFPETTKLGDVSLTNKSSIEVIAGGGGDIFVNANNFSLNNSSFRAGIKDSLGSKDTVAGDIYINATENINIDRESNIRNILELNSLGDGGQIDIQTKNFFLKDSNILSNTGSVGNAGDITVVAQNTFEIISSPINLTKGRKGRKGLTSTATINATGNGGNISVVAPEINLSGIGGISGSTVGFGNGGKVFIKSDRINIIEGSSVSSNTGGMGNAGEIFIKASEFIEANNKVSDSQFANVRRPPGGIVADVRTGGGGNGGKITIETGRLSVRNGAIVTTDTKGKGNGGDINLRATELVEVTGRLKNDINMYTSQLVTAVRENAQGEGGNLFLETKNLIVADGAEIDVSTDSNGDSGNLEVIATESISLGGLFEGIPSRLQAQVGELGSGNGGSIKVETAKLSLLNGAQISAANLGRGNSGNVNISADEINIAGSTVALEKLDVRTAEFVKDKTGNLFPSGVFSSSPGVGNAGDLNVETGKLTLDNKAQISVSSQQVGAAGNLEIQANQIYLNNAIISADTVAGDKGSIYFNGKDIRLRQGSKVTTNATQTATGGNIDIDTLTLVGLENSDITANAEDNFGGRVIINAEALFGIAFRDFLTPESDVTATSALGAEFNGVVEINTPDIDPTSALEELPEGFTDSSQIQAGCAADGGNKFAETGRGGLPKSPQEVLRSQVVVEDWRISAGEEVEKAQREQEQKNIKRLTPIVEARGWIVNQDGVVELVANLPQKNINLNNSSLNCG
ncbi:MAG: filamentous hemagglutinin N-terminal domain-containing protein [Rivularia sp. (in: Bacteria)]|nr:filamentous hemagglutinin N-terminal domain-containing protein [Rivularia sp. MS3]